MKHTLGNAIKSIAIYAVFLPVTAGFYTQAMAQGACAAQSGDKITPVVELYTSEGCSSCPPADAWASTLKPQAQKGQVVVQAFHVGYWDYIGWVDRFAAPAHTQRQRQISAANRLDNIYTPQFVLDGRDWRGGKSAPQATEKAQAALNLRQTKPNSFEANVTPADAGAPWAAYWSVTEHGHASKVTAGENKGENLPHDFVVRQYVPVGQYQGAQTLRFEALNANPKHPRQVNLVVFDPRTQKTLQAISLGC
jgi:hypothetical protein